ncbi:MAG: hypothetical protein KC501_11570 [Myxococcales bacterium]|nr:hypothetical protein [Myxococcales bacterium]
MMARRSRPVLPAAITVLAAATLAAAPLPALAGGTHNFELSDHAELDAGETEGAAIEASGKVTVGFTPTRGAPQDASTAFTCLGRKDDVLVGTADEAAVHRVSVGSRGKDKDKVLVERVAKLDGVVVTAMVELPGGDLVVATLPGGKLQRVTAKGKVSDFAELPVEQVWALRVHDGTLYAGTGPKGELFAMSLAGKDPKVVLDDSDKHIMSLLSVGDALLVGTAPGARLLKVGDDPEGLLLKDFDGDELRDMVTTRDGLLVAVNTFDDRNLGSADALAQNLARSSLSGPPPSGDLEQQRPVKADAAVFHVDLGKGRDLERASEAPWEEWFSRDGQYFTSLLALDDVGTVLVASSADGKVYRMRGPRDAATVADFEERQATALCRAAKGPIFATAGQGAAAYHLLSTPAKKARYRTKVLDAKQPSEFGALALRGKGPLSARVRVGPSKEPDDRWSKWTEVKLVTETGGRIRGQLPALGQRRYLQLEISLGSPDAELYGIEQFYAPENLAPLLTEVELSRPDFNEEDDDEPSSKVTIRWKVDARDDDDLEFGVRARPEGTGETQWIPLHDRDAPVTKRELSWDLSTVPDGVYEVEVVASDEPSNGADKARTDELRSAPFVVDRQRPRIEDLRYGGGKLTATVRDAGTYVHDVSVKVDDGPFRTVAAADGMYDEPDEVISHVLDRVKPGTHRVVVRARDAFGNIETAAIVAKVE